MFKSLTVFLISTVTFAFAEHNSGPEDRDLSFASICEKNGFAFEEHSLTTTDGYILSVFRIPGKIGVDPANRPPVMFQHGITSSADTWIMHYADKAPAFVAAAAGYDVWLGNSRGNVYSNKHTHLDPVKDEETYWDFDWEDMGTHDMPRVLDYIT
jgi:lysosomal acid lipase/cholesteryl ester hydrolase